MSNGINPYSKISKLPICITKNCSTSSASRHLETENTALIIPADLVHCAIQSAWALAQPSSPARRKWSPGLGANLCSHLQVWGRATTPRVMTRRSPRRHIWGSWASHWLKWKTPSDSGILFKTHFPDHWIVRKCCPNAPVNPYFCLVLVLNCKETVIQLFTFFPPVP